MTVNLPHKIGIWGLGVVGKSIARFLHAQGHEIGVLDRKSINPEEQEFLHTHAIRFFPESEQDNFFSEYTTIIPSAGIDLRSYAGQLKQHTLIGELDLFDHILHRQNTSIHKQQTTTPIIAITGSLGKTSITQLLSQIISATGARVATGGNIGVGLLDLIDTLTTADYGVLELSSFQLESTQHFAPHLAIITNLYPNHLDRHGDLEAYWTAKYNILAHQQPHNLALIHADLFDRIKSRKPHSTCAYFSEKRPSQTHHNNHDAHGHAPTFYYFDNTGAIIKEHRGIIKKIASANDLPDISYPINWLVILATLDLLNIPQPNLSNIPLDIPDHRLHHVATINMIDFYNDSKSTVPEATLTALTKLASKNRPIIALIGGMGKGVDRAPFIRKLKPLVKTIICFGGEAHTLNTHAEQAGIPSYAQATLEEAFAQAVALSQPGDQIILSPAGSSFDLLKNYQARGEKFKELVMHHLGESS